MARDGRREQQPREAKLTAIASFLNRDVTGVMAATRKRKAEDRHAREALAQDNLYPRIAALSRRVLRSEKV
jgi:hypothetical protein